MSNFDVTIISATFNCRDDLTSTAHSIRSQDRIDLIQWIIIDGGSVDGTLDVINNNLDIIYFYKSESDAGIYDAWNKGCEFILGKWVVFLGAGDLLGPHWVEILSRQSSDFDIVYGDVVLRNNIHQIDTIQISPDWIDVKDKLTYKMCLCHTGLAVNSRHLRDKFPFDTSYRICADWVYLVRKNFQHGLYIPNVIQAYFIVGGISSSTQNVDRYYSEIQTFMKERNLKIPIIESIRFIFFIFLKNHKGFHNLLRKIYWRIFA